MDLLLSPPRDLIEVFDFINSTEFGSQLTTRLRAFSENRDLEIRIFPHELEQRYRASGLAGSPGTAHGAFFLTDGDFGTIYIDPGSEIAVLAPFLVHEMVHAMDESLWGAAKQPPPKLLKERLIIDSEYRAYQAQFQFLRQVFGTYPKLKAHLQSRYPGTPALSRELTYKEIARTYLHGEVLSQPRR